MTCVFYRDKPLNIQDGYNGSCSYKESEDKICPYYGDLKKCSYPIKELLTRQKAMADDVDREYIKQCLMIFIRDIESYTKKEIARILTGLAKDVDRETAIITASTKQSPITFTE